MFTKKNRKIANLEAMIKNRDKLIKDLLQKKDYYKRISEEQRKIIAKQEELLKAISDLATSNTYNNDKVVLSKIIELFSSKTKTTQK